MDNDSDRVSTLEQTVAKLQAKDIENQNKLGLIFAAITWLTQNTPNAPTPILPPSADSPKTRTACPAAPDFDGDRTKGTAFLNSCQTYIQLCPKEFPDDQVKIVWAMSYMKSGYAQKWTAHIFCWEQQPDNFDTNKFLDWEDFQNEFKKSQISSSFSAPYQLLGSSMRLLSPLTL